MIDGGKKLYIAMQQQEFWPTLNSLPDMRPPFTSRFLPSIKRKRERWILLRGAAQPSLAYFAERQDYIRNIYVCPFFSPRSPEKRYVLVVFSAERFRPIKRKRFCFFLYILLLNYYSNICCIVSSPGFPNWNCRGRPSPPSSAGKTKIFSFSSISFETLSSLLVVKAFGVFL